MTTQTFVSPNAKYRLIVTQDGGIWTAEVRCHYGQISTAFGPDYDQVLGVALLTADRKTGDNMAVLSGMADDYFAAESLPCCHCQRWTAQRIDGAAVCHGCGY